MERAVEQRAGSGPVPGEAFGEAPAPPRALDPGIGQAVARRTVFRAEDREDWGRVADRVAAGNMALLGAATEPLERARLRNAIASGALLTSGRHLQHGDATQPGRPMELFTNCATAIASFALFYLLLNGAGVGRAYDDELMLLDWAEAPELRFRLDPAHPDWPGGDPALPRVLEEPAAEDAVRHAVEDSREGWAKAVEILEAMVFAGSRGGTLLLDLSAIRPAGAPIRGMQGRPAPGPVPLLCALLGIREQVIVPARAGSLPRWEQAMRVDHLLAAEVQAAGTRRGARMATKSWRDPDAVRFARLKQAGGHWSANHSLMVDAAFWAGARRGEGPAAALFAAATEAAHATGEPGFINADLLEDARTGSARAAPLDAGIGSSRYRVDAAAGLMAALRGRAAAARYPVTTNPCGEVVLHVAGGYCVVADVAPLLACPVPFAGLAPGAVPEDVAASWDARVEAAVRLGVRFLIRVNRMDALYGAEVRRTDRIGIGLTGLHEWAWMRFGLDFHDLLDAEGRGRPFWAMLARLSATAKEEATAYATALGMAPPLTVTTVKPSGTVSKLFGLSEGAHLPARRHYLRWVQFRGARGADGAWLPGSDPLLRDYAARGYPLRALREVAGSSIIGFPTLPLALRLGMGERLVTAVEATPEQHLRWLHLLDRHWIGASRGNQVSYTLRLPADGATTLADFRRLLLAEMPGLRCCSVLPIRPDSVLGYEYLPEEEVDEARFAAILAGIRDPGLHEAVDLAVLACQAGICPI